MDRPPPYWRLTNLLRWSRRQVPLPEAVYRDLITILFSMRLPVLGLGIAFVGIGALIGAGLNDPLISLISVSAAVVTLLRIRTLYAFKRRSRAFIGHDELEQWERRYAMGGYAFALLIGALNAQVLTYHYPLLHMITISLLFGYAAGVVARISVRPVICCVSLALAVVPTVLGLAVHATTASNMPMHAQLFAAEAALVLVIAMLSLETVRYLYRAVVQSVTMRHDLTLLAKQDDLTGLPNRLLLRERFQHSIGAVAKSERRLALHFLDLDGFKAVNDRHGHPAGDALLREVARRLTGMVRSEDTVARLGGDEFVVVQAAIGHSGEAEMLARRIIKQLSAPYEIDGKEMRISVSIGIALAPEQGLDFDRLAACADAALYRSKGGGKGQLHFCDSRDVEQALASRVA